MADDSYGSVVVDAVVGLQWVEPHIDLLGPPNERPGQRKPVGLIRTGGVDQFLHLLLQLIRVVGEGEVDGPHDVVVAAGQ